MNEGGSSRGQLAVLLATAYQVTMAGLTEHLAAAGHPGVRPAHGFVFLYLSNHPTATSVELGTYLGVTKQAGGQLVDELVRRGYVTREPHPSDRRARVLRLTEQGWDCIERVVAYWDGVERRWATLVGPEQLDATRSALAAYVADAPHGVRPVW
jgi:DNA-binding MarR family transcriptional regulator